MKEAIVNYFLEYTLDKISKFGFYFKTMIDRIQKLIDEVSSFTTNSATELEAFQ